MKWFKRIAVALSVLLALLAAVPFFLTPARYIPTIEKEMSSRLGEPVTIKALTASLFPVPHLAAQTITIGGEHGVTIAKLTIKPELLSLFGAEKVIRRVEAEELVLSSTAIAALASLAKRDTARGGVRVDEVDLDNVVVKLEHANVGPLDVRVRLASGSTQGGVTIRTRDDALTARITPKGDAYALEIAARDWTSPVGPALKFTELNVNGTATAHQAELTDIRAKLYGGTMAGRATIGWDKNVSVKGSFDVSRIDIKPLASLLSRDPRLSGRLDAKPVVIANAKEANDLLAALRVDTPFTVHDGVLHGLDIATAASTLGQKTSGGDTKFDALSGRMLMEHGAYRFTQLNITSGVLSARGNITIGANKSLTGGLDASAARALTVPLVVAGTLDAPVVYPNTGALAGAALGTAVLGPGLGTAAGAKVGRAVEGLFGRKR